MTRRALALATVLVLAVALAAVGWVLRKHDPACVVPTEALSDDRPALVARRALLPTGSVGEQRRPLVAAADRLPAPFGRVVAGRFYGTAERVPQPVAAGSDLVLAEPPATAGRPTALRDVRLPSGAQRWARDFTGGAASGGPVGDLFVTAVGGDTPALLTLDGSSGELVSCVAVPAASGNGATRVLTDQAGADVVLAAVRDRAAATLSRVAPASGKVAWRRTLPGHAVGGVSTGPRDVVVSEVGHDPVTLTEDARKGRSPTVAAYSLDDGSRSWSVPDDGAAAAVLDVDKQTGATYLLEVRDAHGRTTSSLVALTPDGTVSWRRDLGPGFWDGSLWGDRFVAQGPDPRGGAVLRAFSTRDGAPDWSLHSRDLEAPAGELQRFGTPATVGRLAVMTAPGGLVLVDPETGASTPVRTRLMVDQVLPVGDRLVVRAGEALLVLARDD